MDNFFFPSLTFVRYTAFCFDLRVILPTVLFVAMDMKRSHHLKHENARTTEAYVLIFSSYSYLILAAPAVVTLVSEETSQRRA